MAFALHLETHGSHVRLFETGDLYGGCVHTHNIELIWFAMEQKPNRFDMTPQRIIVFYVCEFEKVIGIRVAYQLCVYELQENFFSDQAQTV